MTENDETNESLETPGPEANLPDDRLAAVERERDETKERMLRLAAEFENWKKRSRREQEDAQFKAKENVLKDILEVADNLERAMASMGESTDAKAVREGVSLVLRLFYQKLERHDVKAIESKGKPFDPRIHEAVAQVPSSDVAAGAIVEELVKGYNLGDRLLRPASVVVAVAPSSGAGDRGAP